MARPYEIYYIIEDGDGKKSRTSFYVDAAVAPAELPAAIDALAMLLCPLLDGAIVDAGYIMAQDLSAGTWYNGLDNVVATTADVEEGATVVFQSAEYYKTSARLATFKESLIVTGTDLVNTSDTDVAAFLAAMTGGLNNTLEGGTLTDIAMSTSHGEAIDALRSFRESFVKTRR